MAMGLKLAILALAAARVGHADTTRLAAAIHGGAEEAEARRHATLAAGAVAGAGFVPIGVMLEERTDPIAHATGIGLIFAGGIPLVFSTLSLPTSSMERFAERFDERRTAGMADDELARRTLDEWRDLAAASRSQRIRLGTGEAVLGLVAAAIGIGLLRHDDHVTSGSVLVGAGVPFIQLGLRGLLQRTPEETWLSHLEDP